MKKSIIYLVLCFFGNIALGQSNNNGRLDTITEFTTKVRVPFTMPDGVRLMTDVYLPIISDSVVATFNILGQDVTLEIIPKGSQLFVYDSLNGDINPNQFKLPMVLSRTPYGKGDLDFFGVYLNILGISYAYQDVRGRYASEGVYLPMYSDGWDKSVYHPLRGHLLDITDPMDPQNANLHEDGRNSISFIQDSLLRDYDLDGDGIQETRDLIYDGSLAMLGASALGNNQYQAASAFAVDVTKDGLKGMLPIVATNEHFATTIQHNGVFRQALVQGWITGQMGHNTQVDTSDNDIQNNIHSLFDYGNISEEEVLKRALDMITSTKDKNGFTGMYPNHIGHADINASFAPVDAQGESDPEGEYSRYRNMELPMYHLTGWWDIFINGQIDTYNHIIKNTSPKTARNQKLVIGPWTHGTISTNIAGDLIFPPSVFDISLINALDFENLSLGSLLGGSELVDWFRYLLNYNAEHYIGEPKILIRESQKWQNLGLASIRIPSEDYYITYADFINFLGGFNGMDSFPLQIRIAGNVSDLFFDVPVDTTRQIPGAEPVSDPISAPVDFEQIPNVRFYMPGPINDGVAENDGVGNYWTHADTFPPKRGLTNQTYYLHNDGKLNMTIPTGIEDVASYIHDPENPVITIGGGNLVLNVPGENRANAGPMNLANPVFAPVTMDREGVVQFVTEPIQDSLAIVGIPKATIFASSNPLSGPSGATDTDFFVRILDVYPDGREIFVVEGAVNARARDYANNLSMGVDDRDVQYSNIVAGEVYEFTFDLLPIAYTFGHMHKMKVLVSSSNWPRYQSNPNIPIEEGDFFRRSPGDGQSYTFNGEVYAPRSARQELHFSPARASRIILPVYDGTLVATEEPKDTKPALVVHPNPTTDRLTVRLDSDAEYIISLYATDGKELLRREAFGETSIDMRQLPNGVYLLKILDSNANVVSRKIIKQ